MRIIFFAGSWSFRTLKASINTSNFTQENDPRGKIYQEPGKRGSKWSQNFVNSFLWQWGGIENAATQHRAFGQALQELTRITSVDMLKGTRSDAGRVRKDTGGIHESVKRLAYTLRKEVKLMPIILTIHVFGLTVTVRIKRNSNNRHSAKWRLFELITRSFEWGQPLLAVSLFQLSLYWRQLILSRQ